MKVNIGNKKLLQKYYKAFVVASVFTTLIFFFDIPSYVKLVIGCIVISFVILACVITWCKANHMHNANITIHGSNVQICIGDIFTEDCIKVIAFNEYFDTKVDNIVISENSLNGQYINKCFTDVSMLDKNIINDKHIKNCCCGKNVNRGRGKKNKYELGTIHVEDNYFLVAFSRFDKDNKAYLSMKDFVACLLNFGNEVDIFYANRSVAIPLLGSGITRFTDRDNVTDQELLDIILWTFKTSKVSFKDKIKLKIVLTEDAISKINLFYLKDKYCD